MNLKSLLVFVTLFAIQFLYSCDLFFGSGYCDGVRDYHVNLVGLEIETYHYNNEWDYNQELPDSVSRSNDDFQIMLTFTPDFVAEPSTASFWRVGGGFSSVLALSDVDCPPSLYYLVDPIESIEIQVVDASIGDSIEANSLFTYSDWYNYDNEYVSDVEFSLIDHFYEVPALMYFYLDDASKTPDSTIFRVQVEMESGTILTSETEVIAFY